MSTVGEVIRSVINIKKAEKETVPYNALMANMAFLVYESGIARMFNVFTDEPFQLHVLKIIVKHYDAFREVPSYHMVLDTLKVKVPEIGSIEDYIAVLDNATTERPWIGGDFKSCVQNLTHEWTLGYLEKVLGNTYQIAKASKKIGIRELSGIGDAITYASAKIPEVLSLSKGIKTFDDPDIDEIVPEVPDLFWLTFPHPEMESRHRIRNGELCFVAAIQGGGKTSFLSLMAAKWSKQGRNGLFYSLEMPTVDIYRLFYITSFNNFLRDKNQPPISDTKTDRSLLTEYDRKCLLNGIATIQNTWGSFKVGYEPDLNTAKMKTAILNQRSEMHNLGKTLDYVMVDYAGLMSPTELRINKSGATEYTNRVVKELKMLAMELNLPIISAFQLNREYSKASGKDGKNSKPQLHHLSYANEVEKSADHALLMHIEDEDMEKKIFSLYMRKARKEAKPEYSMEYYQDTKIWKAKKQLADPSMVDLSPQIPLDIH
jgi:hypothetical protein